MDKNKINELVGAEIDRAMEAAHVTTPRVIKAYIQPRVMAEVDHQKDSIIVEARTNSGKLVPVAEFLETLRRDTDFQSCFELALRPREQETPYEIRHGVDEQRPGDLQAIATGKAIVTGWWPEQEVPELAADEIAQSDRSQLNTSVEEIARGEKKVRLGV